MKRLILWAVRIYPPRWRSRYGGEFIEMLRQLDASPAVLLDVLASASKARIREAWAAGTRFGGGRMLKGATRQPQRLALIGLVVMLPTLVLVTVAVLKYVIGVPGPFELIEPAMTPIVTHPAGETVLTLAPYLAVVLAAMPVTRLGVRWRAGRLSATLQVAAPALNLAVVSAGVMLATFMALYWVAENL